MPRLFSIIIQVEEVALGAVMRVLHNTEGVAKFDLDMEGMKYKPNGKDPGKPRAPYKPRGSYAISGETFVAQLLGKAGKPLRASDLSEGFRKAGRSPHSVNSVVHGLKQQGLISLTPDGYVLSKKMKDRLRHRKGA